MPIAVIPGCLGNHLSGFLFSSIFHLWLVESADREPTDREATVNSRFLTRDQRPPQSSPPLPSHRSLWPMHPSRTGTLCAACPPPGFPLAGLPPGPPFPKAGSFSLSSSPLPRQLLEVLPDHLSKAAPSRLTSFLTPMAHFRVYNGVRTFVYCYTHLPGGMYA